MSAPDTIDCTPATVADFADVITNLLDETIGDLPADWDRLDAVRSLVGLLKRSTVAGEVFTVKVG